MLVHSGVPSDFPALRPMLLDMGFVEDEAALEDRFLDFCGGPAYTVFVEETKTLVTLCCTTTGRTCVPATRTAQPSWMICMCLQGGGDGAWPSC